METIGKYRIREKIGTGGMALVYRAVDEVTGREVALKTLSVVLADDHETRLRFFLEARVAGGLSHPNIVTVYDFGEASGRAFIAMELFKGESLRNRIDRVKPSINDTVRIVTDIARGLAHAHHQGIIHRDIKPSNVFLCDSRQTKILDFGLAHINSSNLTRTGQVLGTPNYMSPEQVLGDRLDHRADIFSLGAVSYELLTGHKPFADRSIEHVLYKIVSEESPLMELYDPSIPDKLCRIVRKALAKRPSDRFRSMIELLQELERLPRDSKNHERKSRPTTGATAEGTPSAFEPDFREQVLDQILDALSAGQDSGPIRRLPANTSPHSELSKFLLSELGPFGADVFVPRDAGKGD